MIKSAKRAQGKGVRPRDQRFACAFTATPRPCPSSALDAARTRRDLHGPSPSSVEGIPDMPRT
ncbi:hypothetical protein [Actinomadura sp. WAC 06369]|uniref:hypothetical protein n=1 Tax=Actinomadura sp. WAC 06369 TaxID=2203193 RepID=UPI000F7B4D49|nr:hypothetical protein [Actinomadura sp. WAC 06369]